MLAKIIASFMKNSKNCVIPMSAQEKNNFVKVFKNRYRFKNNFEPSK